MKRDVEIARKDTHITRDAERMSAMQIGGRFSSASADSLELTLALTVGLVRGPTRTHPLLILRASKFACAPGQAWSIACNAQHVAHA